MKAKDLREKSTEDLNELLKTTARGVFDSRFKNFTNRLDDTSMIRKTRRELARIHTLLAERARGATPVASPGVQGVDAPVAKAKPAKVKAAAPSKPAADKPSKPAAEKKTAAKKTTKKSEAK